MFEEYLEDGHYFFTYGSSLPDDEQIRRYYRASVFCIASAMEAYINYIGDIFASGGNWPPYEVAYLTDKKFEVKNGAFIVSDQMEFHRLEDKLRFMICKFNDNFDFAKCNEWSDFQQFRKFRDKITHPRQDNDETPIRIYADMICRGLNSSIFLMDTISFSVMKKHLRRNLLDLRLS